MSSTRRASLYSSDSSSQTQIQLFAWGDNSSCACALPSSRTNEPVKQPTTVFKQEKNKPATWLSTVRQMCTGRSHSLFLTIDGKVLACGDNSKTQCGLFKDQAGSFLPRLVRMKKRITCVSAGADHSIWITEEGEMWASGSNSHGQLGRIQPVENVSMPRKLASNNNKTSPVQRNVDMRDVIWASCGQNYTILLTKNEELWAIGDNSHGQLGCGTKSPSVKIPQKVLLRPRPGIGLQLKKIRAGASHTIYLTHDGYIYICGSNEFGQCGFSRDVMDLTQPTLLPPKMFGNLAILDIACGLNHSVFLTQNHTVYVCGSNLHGECGIGSKSLTVFRPVEIPNFQCKSIHCGSLHSFFLKRDNTLWGCGLNESAQLGIGTTKNEYTMKQIHFDNDDDPNLRITKVSCGFGDFSLVTKVHVVPQAPPKVTPPVPDTQTQQPKHPDLSELDDLLRDLEAMQNDIQTARETNQKQDKDLNYRITDCIKKFQSFCSSPRVGCR